MERLPTLPERKVMTEALRALGLSHRQIAAYHRDGWKGLVGASQAEADELREQLDALAAVAKRGTRS